MAIKDNITVIVLTSSAKEGADTVGKIGISSKKYGKKFYAISTQFAYIDERSASAESITIHNYDGTGKSVTLDPRNVVCFARGGVTNTQIGMAILTIFENTGMFVINERRPMELCANKLYSAIELDANKIPTPRTAFVANLSSLDSALDMIGNKFPVIVKTFTGAEGVGVSIVDSYESLKSVLQSLWKYKAELLIQEYLPIKNDVRVLVLDGKVVAAAMRGKAPKDFRTNLAQGAQGGPYELSDQERKIAERAAEVFGTYYVGVDMVLSGGKPYVIELNASPGSGNVYRSYFPGSEGSSITGQRLIDQVVKHAINRDNWHFNHREAGLIEPIEVQGIGQFRAKLDTGNESYNVLGAENIEEFNGTVNFTVNGKKYEKPIVSHVRIRTNNINVDRRPVVEFDVEFRNRTFRNVRFSLVPRRFNKYPVLIGNRFMNMAKISVNVNTANTLPEQVSQNHYVSKINTLTTFAEIEEMRDMMIEKLTVAKTELEKQTLEEALGHINVAKYNLKNAQHQAYNGNTIMHADKKFQQFLENAQSQHAQQLDEQVVIDEARRSRSVFSKKLKGRPKKEDYDRLERATQRRIKKAEKLKGISTRKKKGQKPAHKGRLRGVGGTTSKAYSPSRAKELERLYKRKKYKDAAPKEYNPEMASIRFWNYTKNNPRRNDFTGKPIQTGAKKGRIDGDIKGRFKRYYGKDAEGIRSRVSKLIQLGKWPSPRAAEALRKGRAMRHKKK